MQEMNDINKIIEDEEDNLDKNIDLEINPEDNQYQESESQGSESEEDDYLENDNQDAFESKYYTLDPEIGNLLLKTDDILDEIEF